MKVDEEFVTRVAKVARLDLKDEEVKNFVPQINEVLDMFSVIDDCDVSDTEPSFQPIKIEPYLREDNPKTCLAVEEVLSLTEHKKNNFFKGPKVI
jgi:aspartyl-tRNA(Asn)/glutamyl-tRNA(Gln) amidotransferase subunit C